MTGAASSALGSGLRASARSQLSKPATGTGTEHLPQVTQESPDPSPQLWKWWLEDQEQERRGQPSTGSQTRWAQEQRPL